MSRVLLGSAQAVGCLLLMAGLLLGSWEPFVCGLVVIVSAAVLRRHHG